VRSYSRQNAMWDERSMAKVVVKCLHIKMSRFAFQFQRQTFQTFFSMVELILEDLWLWPLPARHHVHEGRDKRDLLSPIVGDKTNIHIWYHDKRKIGRWRKAWPKVFDMNYWIFFNRVPVCTLIQTSKFEVKVQLIQLPQNFPKHRKPG